MSGFESRWLDLREPVDRRARHAGLRRLAVELLNMDKASSRVVDLGCGTGSTFRALAPEASGIRWRLVDNDPRLLDEAKARHGAECDMEFVELDLAALSDEVFAGVTLVTASALFDIVSLEVVQALAEILRQRGAGLYAALNYDGTCSWSGRHEADDFVVEAFNKHQRGDKGLGPALGPDSGPAIKRVFESAGFKVSVARSPWRFGAEDAELHNQFIEGMAKAAGETRTLEPVILEDWRRYRLARVTTSTCEVGHWDVIALSVCPRIGIVVRG